MRQPKNHNPTRAEINLHRYEFAVTDQGETVTVYAERNHFVLALAAAAVELGRACSPNAVVRLIREPCKPDGRQQERLFALLGTDLF